MSAALWNYGIALALAALGRFVAATQLGVDRRRRQILLAGLSILHRLILEEPYWDRERSLCKVLGALEGRCKLLEIVRAETPRELRLQLLA